jgi:two-component system copper resistance phosphate regulon response regulator CusR
MRVLVVEDEQKVANALREGLEGEKYDVVVERTGEDAFFRLTTEAFDLILLDLGLPGRDGLQILTTLRGKGIKTPVLVLTARDTLQDRVAGLDSGADDYLVKPFAFAELLARIRALLRRDSQLRPDILEIEDLVVDAASHRVSRADDEVQLTAKEYALLEYLARRAGQLVSRAEIAAHVWDDTFDPFSNVIEVYINRLRKKIDGKHLHKLLHTRRGEGYILESRH